LSVGIPDSAPFTPDEKKILSAFAEKLGEQIAKHNVRDNTMIRFVRGYRHLENAAQVSLEKFTEFLAWRDEMKIQQIIAMKHPKAAKFHASWPSAVHGVSKLGHPVYVERIGQMDPSTINTEFTIDELIQFHIQSMEKLCQLKEDLTGALGKLIYKHIAVLDLNGFGTKHMGKTFYDPLKKFINIDQHKYPETLFCMIIANAPWVFKALWTVASPWLDAMTKQRIFFDAEELFKWVDKDQVPQFLKGTCACPKGKCLEVPFDFKQLKNYKRPEEKEAAKSEPAKSEVASDKPAGGAVAVADKPAETSERRGSKTAETPVAEPGEGGGSE